MDTIGFSGEWGCITDNESAPTMTGNPTYRIPVVWMGHREYDPSVGRFLTRDPAGYEAGVNLYAYCGNNPILHADPMGLDDGDDDADYGTSIWGQLRNPAVYGNTWWGRAGSWLLHAPGKLGWAALKKLTAVKMKPGTPTLRHPYIDADLPESAAVNGRYVDAGRAVNQYIDQTGEMITGTALTMSVPELLKGIASLEQRVAEHEAKLAEYTSNPEAFDNQGLLRNAPSEAIRQRIIDGRIRHITKEIDTFRRNIEKLRGQLPR